MRNPKNSWNKSDTMIVDVPDTPRLDYSGNVVEVIPAHKQVVIRYEDKKWEGIGEKDIRLMTTLCNAGTDHRKFMRMIIVYLDITAPLYYWKEFDTYKVGTVASSCSTMHKIADKEFTIEDFSYEHLDDIWGYEPEVRDMAPTIEFETHTDKITNYVLGPDNILNLTIKMLNRCRDLYLKTKEKTYWWQMIQLLPSSYNQKRTVMLNYEVLANIYKSRKNHKLDEWKDLCKWISSLPYSELIIGAVEE